MAVTWRRSSHSALRRSRTWPTCHTSALARSLIAPDCCQVAAKPQRSVGLAGLGGATGSSIAELGDALWRSAGQPKPACRPSSKRLLRNPGRIVGSISGAGTSLGMRERTSLTEGYVLAVVKVAPERARQPPKRARQSGAARARGRPARGRHSRRRSPLITWQAVLTASKHGAEEWFRSYFLCPP